jgi:hypothetical protein
MSFRIFKSAKKFKKLRKCKMLLKNKKKQNYRPGLVVLTCNPSTGEAETRELQV